MDLFLLCCAKNKNIHWACLLYFGAIPELPVIPGQEISQVNRQVKSGELACIVPWDNMPELLESMTTHRGRRMRNTPLKGLKHCLLQPNISLDNRGENWKPFLSFVIHMISGPPQE